MIETCVCVSFVYLFVSIIFLQYGLGSFLSSISEQHDNLVAVCSAHISLSKRINMEINDYCHVFSHMCCGHAGQLVIWRKIFRHSLKPLLCIVAQIRFYLAVSSKPPILHNQYSMQLKKIVKGNLLLSQRKHACFYTVRKPWYCRSLRQQI